VLAHDVRIEFAFSEDVKAARGSARAKTFADESTPLP